MDTPRPKLDRQQIIDVAARRLREHGYAGIDMREIAAELGFCVGSLYRYFEDKQALIGAVARAVVGDSRDIRTDVVLREGGSEQDAQLIADEILRRTGHTVFIAVE